jgi:hypothetical protein
LPDDLILADLPERAETVIKKRFHHFFYNMADRSTLGNHRYLEMVIRTGKLRGDLSMIQFNIALINELERIKL